MKRIVIIGNGIAGITAARHLRKLSNHSITVISSETEHFFSRTALMYIYMGHMKYEHTKPYEDWFWKKNKIDLIKAQVMKVHISTKELELDSGQSISYDVLILATGSKPTSIGWPGQDAKGVQGLYSFQDLELLETNTRQVKHAVIVGGGLIGIELAEMLRSRKIEVTMLVREQEFWRNVLPQQEATLLSGHIKSHHVNLRLSTELKEILTNAEGKVVGVLTLTGEKIECEFVGLTIGVTPNIHFLLDSGVATNRGILVNEYLQTNIGDVYAIGDCVERTYDLKGRKNIEQVWYTGRMMGEVVAQTICGVSTKYEPGPWFNSAKFFDIEYQTYGIVGSELKAHESEFYWEHADRKKAMHFVWDTATKHFIGINTFGIRLRHEKFDQWLRSARSISYVIDHLPEANFDPEFSVKYEEPIKKAFRHAHPQLLSSLQSI